MANFLADIARLPARNPRYGGVIGRRALIAVPTGLVALDTMELCQIPKGAIVTDGKIFHDDLGTGMVISLGYLGGDINGVPQDPNAYLSGLDVSTVNSQDFNQLPGLVDQGAFDAERPLAITFTGVGSATVGADIGVEIRYVLAA